MNRQVDVEILKDGQSQSRITLYPGDWTIGRTGNASIVLPDVGVSRRHACLHVDGQGLWIEDIASGNGTFYRGSRIDRQVIGDQDEVQIDRFTLRFLLGPEPTGEITLKQGQSSTAIDNLREISHLVGMGRMTGLDLLLTPDRPFILGRAPSCDLVLPEPMASREHAEVVFHEGAWWLRDRGSSNGSYVNGNRIRDHLLSPGDRVRIGTVEMRFVRNNQIEGTLTRAVRRRKPLLSPLNQALIAILILSMGCAGLVITWQLWRFAAPLLRHPVASTPAPRPAPDMPAPTPAPPPAPPTPSPVARPAASPSPAASPTTTPTPTPPPAQPPIIATPHTTPAELLQRGEGMVATNPAAALRTWEELISTWPSSPEAAAAVVRIEQVKAQAARKGNASWTAAQKSFQQWDYVAARNLLKESLRQDPFNTAARSTLEGVQKQLRQEAEATYKQARTMEDIEKTAEAISLYRKVMTLVGDPNDEFYKKAQLRMAGLGG